MIGETCELQLPHIGAVEVAEMDGHECGLADGILSTLVGRGGSGNDVPVMAIALQQLKVYAICSIRKASGGAVRPFANIAEYTGLAGNLSYRDIQKLSAWAYPLYNPSDDEVKKEPAAEE